MFSGGSWTTLNKVFTCAMLSQKYWENIEPVQCCHEPIGQHCTKSLPVQCCPKSIKTTLNRFSSCVMFSGGSWSNYHDCVSSWDLSFGKKLGVTQGVRGRNRKTSEKKPKSVFWFNLLEFSGLYQKKVWCVIHYLALDYWCKFQKNLTAFGGVMVKQPARSSLKSNFLFLWKHLKVNNLTTTNPILMKLTTIMYLHEIFHLARNWGVTHRA